MLEGRALVVAANKADLLPLAMTRSQYEEGVRKHCAAYLPELGNLRVVCCVANKREGVNRYARMRKCAQGLRKPMTLSLLFYVM